MKFSENWLRDFVNPALDSDALGHLLTMAGLEVESQTTVAPAFNLVVVAHIISAQKHPDADRLQVLQVDVGQENPLQIVCGATNARAGLKSVCALVGANLPGLAIKQAKVRGVESFGMMCSEKELGLANESLGIMELADDTPVGQSIRHLLELDDTVFELKLTPNRADCLSIFGIAREVSALANTALKPIDAQPALASNSSIKNITIDAPDACPRYCGRIIQNVNAQANSPEWMKRRLMRSGIRSISALVDITNYVLLEMGQPMHAFDLDKISGDIQVRYAKPVEKLTLLNDETVDLHDDMLVIADTKGAIALAGIMGGNSTSVSLGTTNVFLESAFFTPKAITGRARRLGLSTDSSFRFERGVDFSIPRMAMERATALITDICGGTVCEINEQIATLPERNAVSLRVKRAQDVIGIALEEATIAKLLQRLGLSFIASNGEFNVTPPAHRFDIQREEDLIEEIVRLHGYELLPAQLPAISNLEMLPAIESHLHTDVLRQKMVSAGYHEAITFSFINAAWETDLLNNAAAIPLRNPIASNMSVMRSSLWGGLLESLEYNLNRKQDRVRLFELGTCFFNHPDTGYSETQKLGGICYGDSAPEQWGAPSHKVDFYDVKHDVETLSDGKLIFRPARHPALHPGQSAQIFLGEQPVGWLGALHPQWQQKMGLALSPILFELEVSLLTRKETLTFTEVPKFPPVRRDIAVVVDESVQAQELIDSMQKSADHIVHEIALFDVYRGESLGNSKKSLAFRVLMQDTQKTLIDADADAAMIKLVAVLSENHGAILRS